MKSAGPALFLHRMYVLNVRFGLFVSSECVWVYELIYVFIKTLVRAAPKLRPINVFLGQ